MKIAYWIILIWCDVFIAMLQFSLLILLWFVPIIESVLLCLWPWGWFLIPLCWYWAYSITVESSVFKFFPIGRSIFKK